MESASKRLQLGLVKLTAFAFLVAFGVSSARAAGEFEPVTVRDFSRGLITDQDSTLLPNGASQDLSNVDVLSGSIDKRRGSIKANSTVLSGSTGLPVRFLHSFPDSTGTFWLLSVSSNTIFKSNDGGATNTVGTSTFGITSTSRFQAANAFSTAYFVSGTTYTITFNGITFSRNTAAPLGTTIAYFANRLWIGNLSTLTGSRVADDSDWTDNGLVDEDAFAATIRTGDGYSIRALVPFGPDLLIFKDFSIDRLVINNDGLTFSLIPLTSTLGTSFPETVKVGENRVIWLAHDGFYSYNGSIIKRISEDIQPTIATLPQLAAASRAYTEEFQSQFAAGTSTDVSTAITPDSVVLSTWTGIDTSSTNFAAGSLTNVTTATVTGDLYLAILSTTLFNQSFEIGTGADADGWDEVLDLGRSSATTAQSGTWSMIIGDDHTAPLGYNCGLDNITNPPTVSIIRNGSVVLSTTIALSTSYQQFSINTASIIGSYVYIQLKANTRSEVAPGGCGVNVAVANSDPFIADGTVLAFYAKAYGTSNHYVAYDNLTGGRSSIGTGSFTSRTFDTTLSSAAWLISTPTYTSNGHTVSFQTQASSNGTTWDTAATWTLPGVPTSTYKRYIRYVVNFATATTGTGLPFVSDVTLAARAQHGRYVSQAISLSGATGWLSFAANGDADGGNLTYEIYTDTDTNLSFANGNVVVASFVSSQTITSGATPSISTNSYAHVGTTFSITAATQNPELEDFTLQWAEGNPSLFPAGLYWDRDYYCALAVNSATRNDTIFIFDRNQVWTKYENLPAYSMASYRNRPYIGSNLDAYIIRFQETGRYRDYDDSAITAYWISKDFDFNYPLTSKSLLRYYITGLSSTAGNITLSYGVERGTLTSAAYSTNQTGFFRQVIKPSSLTYTEGLQHRFKFSDSTLDGPFSILSITGRWNLNTNP